MNFKTVRAYIIAVVCGLILLAAVLLVILQWGNPAEFSLYGKNYSLRFQKDGSASGGVNTGLLIIISAAGGILLFYVCKLLVWGIRTIVRSRRATAAQDHT